MVAVVGGSCMVHLKSVIKRRRTGFLAEVIDDSYDGITML
jgi:hypothetical protein